MKIERPPFDLPDPGQREPRLPPAVLRPPVRRRQQTRRATGSL